MSVVLNMQHIVLVLMFLVMGSHVQSASLRTSVKSEDISTLHRKELFPPALHDNDDVSSNKDDIIRNVISTLLEQQNALSNKRDTLPPVLHKRNFELPPGLNRREFDLPPGLNKREFELPPGLNRREFDLPPGLNRREFDLPPGLNRREFDLPPGLNRRDFELPPGLNKREFELPPGLNRREFELPPGLNRREMEARPRPGRSVLNAILNEATRTLEDTDSLKMPRMVQYNSPRRSSIRPNNGFWRTRKQNVNKKAAYELPEPVLEYIKELLSMYANEFMENQ